jgi:hypothetical protein
MYEGESTIWEQRTGREEHNIKNGLKMYTGSGHVLETGSCENGNESSSSIKPMNYWRYIYSGNVKNILIILKLKLPELVAEWNSYIDQRNCGPRSYNRTLPAAIMYWSINPLHRGQSQISKTPICVQFLPSEDDGWVCRTTDCSRNVYCDRWIPSEVRLRIFNYTACL